MASDHICSTVLTSAAFWVISHSTRKPKTALPRTECSAAESASKTQSTLRPRGELFCRKTGRAQAAIELRAEDSGRDREHRPEQRQDAVREGREHEACGAG